MGESELLLDRRDAVLTITFNRPAERNALSRMMLEGLTDVFTNVNTDEGTRVVVLRGAGGKAFSSGSDLTGLRQAVEQGITPSSPDDPFEHALAAVTACPLPVIALIQGFAIGGGCALATACDIRVAAESARLGMPPAKLGLLYSQNELRPFVDLIGPGHTKLIFFSGRIFRAETALRFGLVDEVIADADVESYTYTLANEIAANAPLTVRNTKRILRHLTAQQLGETELTDIANLILQTQHSEDFQEGVAAVLEKRRPTFRGR